jgi:N6-L-threonylcarbamoyladenine synthase
MEGHAVSALLEGKGDEDGWRGFKAVNYPAVLLLVSGGHTELILVKEPLSYELLGSTRDDAVGEAFDKTARLLDLSYPGGPEIAKLAEECESESKLRFNLPRPMLTSDDLDFSFSGLKTSVLYRLRELPEATEEIKREMAKEIQDAIAETLTGKTKKTLEETSAKTVILGGGVAANKKIRERFEILAKEKDTHFLIPSMELTTDNALMIALTGYLKAKQSPENVKSDKHKIEKLRADAGLELSE